MISLIRAMKGDITRLDFDLIVNPANTQLLPGGGINKRIFEQAGRGLINELLTQREQKPGSAVLSRAYNLPCQGVIHAVVPVFNFCREEEEDQLASCYWNMLRIAYQVMRKENREHLSLAIPPLGTGPYGFPPKQAWTIGVETIQELFSEFPEARGIDVIFVCEKQNDYQLCKEVLRREIHG